jgi:hypothetical protein
MLFLCKVGGGNVENYKYSLLIELITRHCKKITGEKKQKEHVNCKVYLANI